MKSNRIVLPERSVDVAVLGAGTAGLSAVAEVLKAGKSAALIDPGPLGTTCARTGCMPSKVFIQVANDFYRRTKLETQGISGADHLKVDIRQVMSHVRKLRDRFVSGVIKDLQKFESILIREQGFFVEPGLIAAGSQRIRASNVVIATGSRPNLLPGLDMKNPLILTSDNFFEQEDLPSRIGIVGIGAIGAELGQALARMGVEVVAYNTSRAIGSLSDPVVQDVAVEILSGELSLKLGHAPQIEKGKDVIKLTAEAKSENVDALFVSVGRRPNLENLNLDKLGISLNERGVPNFDPGTMRITGTNVFIAGDVNSDRPLLHEAADEGRIAGYNSAREETKFCRRTRLGISFTSPNIAVVGSSFAELQGKEYAIGEVRFEGQGRSVIKQENRGILRIYADRSNATLLGAEMIAPAGEHLAHLIAWAIQRQATVFDILQMPFYHPVVEEGLRTALRNLGREVESRPSSAELAMCESAPFSLS